MKTRIRQTVVPGELPEQLELEEQHGYPTIPGVGLSLAQTFADARRVLVVTHNSLTPPGTLGYTVVVQPGCAVGDHYHERREEEILVIDGTVQFRLWDARAGSTTRGLVNVFELQGPGWRVRIPSGVGHAVIALGGTAVLQVLASCDFDPRDDYHVDLSRVACHPSAEGT